MKSMWQPFSTTAFLQYLQHAKHYSLKANFLFLPFLEPSFCFLNCPSNTVNLQKERGRE